MGNGIILTISLSDFLLLVYRNSRDFRVLIFHTVTLLNSLISSSKFLMVYFSSVQFSRSVMSNFLWLHGLQHTRFPSPSPTPGACSNSCPLSQWCHPKISSSVIPFSSCSQSFPASVSFQMSQLFVSGSQSIGASASASVLPMNIQDWFPLWLTC